MARYTLQCVEGPLAGDRVELVDDGTFVIGRKASCSWTLTGDEKVSGQHCELRIEGGVVVLRDLESTNGTRVDGKRIQEIPVSHGDRFRVGQTVLELVDSEAGDVGAADDMSLRITDDLLRKSSKRSPVALLVLVAIVGLAAGVWWFFLRADAPQRRRTERKVVAVPGNELAPALAHLEGADGGWLAMTRGGAFTRSSGGHTGRFALRADLGGSDGESVGPRFAVAIPAETVRARVGGSYAARAFFKTDGRVAVGLRVCFFKKPPPPDPDALPDEDEEAERRFERRPTFVAGPALSEIDGSGYQEITCNVAVPPGAEEVTLAVVAADRSSTDSSESRVWVDDLSLVAGSDKVGQTLQVHSRNVFVPDAATSNLRINDGNVLSIAALGSRPRDSGSALAELATVMPLTVGDLLTGFAVEPRAKGIHLSGQGNERLVIQVQNEAVEDGGYQVRRVLARAGAESRSVFEAHAGAERIDGVDAIYWGGTLGKVMLTTPKPGRLDVAVTPGATIFTIDYTGPVDLQLEFEDQKLETLRMLRQAEDAYAHEDYGKALSTYRRIVDQSPFDAGSVRKAKRRRSELLARAREAFAALERDFDEARAFEYSGLYRSLLTRLGDLASMESEFGTQFADFRTQVVARLNEVERAKGERRGARLVEVARALNQAGQKRLSHMITAFITRRFPGTEAATQAATIGAKGKEE